MSNIKSVFAYNLNNFMKERSISRRKLSSDLDIKYTTLCDWINGNSEPRFQTIEKISDYLGVSPSEFFIELSDKHDSSSRLTHYTKESKALSVEMLHTMSDDQIRELLNSGFGFKRLSLEEYSEKTGREIKATAGLSFGKPVGDELW